MHYYAEVWVPSNLDVEGQLELVMEPHNEVYDDSGGRGFWDWYQVGGRYTGRHGDYDPYEDPRNIETCTMCGGTGFRCDSLGDEHRSENSTYTCNGCGKVDWGYAYSVHPMLRRLRPTIWAHGPHGPGKCVKWPTGFAPHDGDIVPTDKINSDLECFTLIVGKKVFTKMEWRGRDWVKTEFNGMVQEKLKELGVKSGYMVTVDYHS